MQRRRIDSEDTHFGIQHISFLNVIRNWKNKPGAQTILHFWIIIVVVTVFVSLLTTLKPMNTLSIDLGFLHFHIQISLTLLVAVSFCLLLGPEWGIIPAFLASLTTVLYHQMPPLTGIVYALAHPSMLMVVWFSFFMLDLSPTLSRWRDWMWFAAVLSVGVIISSSGALVWAGSTHLSFTETHGLWEGRLIGDFLQILLINGLFQMTLGPRILIWVRGHFPDGNHKSLNLKLLLPALILLLLVPIALIWAGSMRFLEQARTTLAPLMEHSSTALLSLFQYGLFLLILGTSIALATILFLYATAKRLQQVKSFSELDPLTRTLNRRSFPEIIYTEMNRCRRLGQWLSVIFLDIDHFKQVNDRYGHQAGDIVLQKMTHMLKSRLRPTDHIFRWGGEEFLVLLPHTEHADAVVLAERLRTMIQDTPVETDTTLMDIPITISLGVTGTRLFSIEPDDLVNRSDEACYRAKQKGRNRTEIAPPFTPDLQYQQTWGQAARN